jgi:hypothetical protein
MTAHSAPIDEKTVGAIWRGFGSYLAKQLRNGKGVSVPKLGNFTFSAAHVDLAVIWINIKVYREPPTHSKGTTRLENQFL